VGENILLVKEGMALFLKKNPSRRRDLFLLLVYCLGLRFQDFILMLDAKEAGFIAGATFLPVEAFSEFRKSHKHMLRGYSRLFLLEPGAT
jgi:IS4 transposase